MIILLTGRPCSGKTTISNKMKKRCMFVFQIDGDDLRRGLNSDLGFSENDRYENARRAIEVANIVTRNKPNMLAVMSIIAPTNEIRDMIRNHVKGDYCEIYCDAPFDVCESRDVKGLYQKARNNISFHGQFTGAGQVFESPKNPDLVIDTHNKTASECADTVLKYVLEELQEKRRSLSIA